MSSKELKELLRSEQVDLNKIRESINKFTKKTSNIRVILKRLVKIWEEDDLSRSIKALSIITTMISKFNEYTGFLGKALFYSYVRNSRNLNPRTAGRLNFMMKSVIEVYNGDLDEAYRHAFVFIRQMAIILRKAYESSKDQQSVHNWQFINSLKLWTQFIIRYSDSSDSIASLRHPIVNIIVGTIRLCPSERWIPLRFNCISMLHELSGLQTNSSEGSNNSEIFGFPTKNLFIPTIPLLLDVFSIVDFNQCTSGISKSPFDIRLMLHFSPSQRNEIACIESTCTWLIDLLSEAVVLNATSPAFPDLAYPLMNALRCFLKNCKNLKFCAMIRKLNSAISEHVNFLSKERISIKTITNMNVINNFRLKISQDSEHTPFGKYYFSYKKERVKYLQQLTELKKKQGSDEFDPSHEDDKEPEEKSAKCVETRDKKSKKKKDDEEYSDESDESDGSYDYDDGNNIVHVSSKDRKKANLKREEDSEEEFDIEAALKEVEPMEDDAVSIATSLDQEDDLSDFDLTEYEDEEKEKNPETLSKSKKRRLAKKEKHKNKSIKIIKPSKKIKN